MASRSLGRSGTDLIPHPFNTYILDFSDALYRHVNFDKPGAPFSFLRLPEYVPSLSALCFGLLHLVVHAW